MRTETITIEQVRYVSDDGLYKAGDAKSVRWYEERQLISTIVDALKEYIEFPFLKSQEKNTLPINLNCNFWEERYAFGIIHKPLPQSLIEQIHALHLSRREDNHVGYKNSTQNNFLFVLGNELPEDPKEYPCGIRMEFNLNYQEWIGEVKYNDHWHIVTKSWYKEQQEKLQQQLNLLDLKKGE